MGAPNPEQLRHQPYLEACIARASPVLFLAAAARKGAVALRFLLPAFQMLLQQGLPCLVVVLRALLRIMILVLLALSCEGSANRSIHIVRRDWSLDQLVHRVLRHLSHKASNSSSVVQYKGGTRAEGRCLPEHLFTSREQQLEGPWEATVREAHGAGAKTEVVLRV